MTTAESLEVGWFELDALPELGDHQLFRIKQTLADAPTWFEAGQGRIESM